MMNRIYFGDNLPILREMIDESIDLIYIDPPFNTGKNMAHTKIKTIRDENGDRKGFQGNNYKTIILGKKSYRDSYVSYIDEFLRPRLVEAYRILKPNGSLYFHIDYREVHYCKILLDDIFGRMCFLNEIIWAYDFGGRARSRWPAKHDNILFYVKDPTNYHFNTSEVDRERYLAPALVGPEKAERGKLPTDTWWVDLKSMDSWWQTIVGTNSRERLGYPTQKPIKIIDRIIKASSYPGNVVLDFFAGSGTVGASCLKLRRNFILIDNNRDAMEIMAQRFAGIEDIEWINFNPKPYQSEIPITKSVEEEIVRLPSYSLDFIMLAATASYLQGELEEQIDFWKDSPFGWVMQLPARKKGKLARRLIVGWLGSKGLKTDKPKDSSESLMINGNLFAIKFSTLWTTGIYKFQQIREEGYDYIICLGISPFEAHCWIFDREYAIQHATTQHKGTRGSEYWMAINPKNPPNWVQNHGGNLEGAYKILKGLKKKQ